MRVQGARESHLPLRQQPRSYILTFVPMAEPASNRNRRWIIIAVVLILAAGLLYFALPSARDRVVVRTAIVERASIVKTVPTNGKVEPLDDFQAHAPAPSSIEEIFVHLGDRVSRGQRLLLLDPSDAQLRVATARNSVQLTSQDLRNAQAGGTHDEVLAENADIRTAGRTLDEARTSLNTMTALQAKGAASANEVASAQERVTDAEAHITQLQARLHGRYGTGDLANNLSQVQRADQELATAKSALGGLDIHSPIAGTVYSLPVARYDYVQPGQALLSIANLYRLQVRAFFDEPEIGALHAGEPVTITWDAKLGHEWHGHVTQAPTTVVTVGTRNVGECLISIDDADGQLLPNTNVTVTVTTLRLTDVLSLPREALHTEGNSDFVFRTRVEIQDGLLQGAEVALGATTDTDLHDGLAVRAQPR